MNNTFMTPGGKLYIPPKIAEEAENVSTETH